MRQGANKRSRGRNGRNHKPNIPLRMQTFDSSGPDVRIRGNAWQVHERYVNMARDAFQAGDRVASENFFQHADHYYRLINMNEDGSPRHPQGQQGHGQPPQPGAPQPGMEGGPDMDNDGRPMDPRDQGGEMGAEGFDPRDPQDRRMNGRNPNGGDPNGGPPHGGAPQGGDRGPREHQGRDNQGREHQGQGRGRGQDRGGPDRGQDRGGQDRGDRQPRDQSREALDRHLERHTPERLANDTETADEPRRHPAAD